jgi:hypothetical protein
VTPQSSTRPVSFRIRTDIASKIRPLAQRQGVTDSRLIENLLLEALRDTELDDVDADDPNASLDSLLEQVKLFLEPRRGAGALNEDVILEVFEEIRKSAALSKLHQAAIMPLLVSGLTGDGRRQFVHQRIARFTKTFLGMLSLHEVTLPRSSAALIRSYTKLG